nr:unnamed protein product [Callosobruchus analis]
MGAVIIFTSDKPSKAEECGAVQEDGSVEVRRKRRRQKGLIGTGSAGSNSNFQGSAEIKEKKIWIFLKKFRDGASIEDIKEHLTKNLNVDASHVYAKKAQTYYQTKDNNCYFIGVSPNL